MCGLFLPAINVCKKARKTLQNARNQQFPVFREIVEFLAVEAMFVGGLLEVVEYQVSGHHPPGATAHAQNHAHRHVDHYLSEVVRSCHVQTVKPSATRQLVGRRHNVS